MNHVMEAFSLSSAVRAALFTLPSEPLVQARLTEVLAAAHGEVRITENFGTDITVESFGNLGNIIIVVATILRFVGFLCHYLFNSFGGAVLKSADL